MMCADERQGTVIFVSAGGRNAGLEKGSGRVSRRRDDASHGRPLERYDFVASAGWAATHQRTQAFHSGDHRAHADPTSSGTGADGIVERDDKKTIPPCVYYSLSSYGRTLAPVVEMMCNWGRSHLKRLSARR